MTGPSRPAGPAADVAAVLAALLAGRQIQAEDLARKAGCTASRLSRILAARLTQSRPRPARTAR